MEQEFRVVGPPGCGKTTWLSRQVARAWEKGENVLIASLTRAAAAEVAGRELPIPRDNIGTLHAHCYRSLGRPRIAETKAEYINDWNKSYPQYHMSIAKRDMDADNLDSGGSSNVGDAHLESYQMLRARQATVMPPILEVFVQKWKDWKRANDLVDFTDLIEICVDTTSSAPGNPSVIFIDEGQDMDALEMALVRKWGEQAGYLVTVGDPDQNLYQWRGSDPEAFYATTLRDDQRMVLEQSYRVPFAVHGLAVEWIDKVHGREPVDYQPRDYDGEVATSRATWKNPASIMDDIERHVVDGKSVMVLASCSYMLRPLIAGLRASGLPFHNPYRRARGDWNPLSPAGAGKISGTERLLSFLGLSEQGGWTVEDMERWTAACIIKDVMPGGRDDLGFFYDADDMGVPMEVLTNLMTDEAIVAGMSGDMEWYSQRLLASRRLGADYPITVATARGSMALREPPQVVVGTIHSVKGGEADVVFLMPDLSMAGNEEWRGSARSQAAVRRLFYVGMTRARETLVLCAPGGKTAVRF